MGLAIKDIIEEKEIEVNISKAKRFKFIPNGILDKSR